MKSKLFATAAAVLAATLLVALLCLMGQGNPPVLHLALAAPAAPTVTAVDPASAPNDLDTPIVIIGTDFTADMSGTLVITQPTVRLGNLALNDVGWISSTTLTATCRGGLTPACTRSLSSTPMVSQPACRMHSL